MAILNLKKLSQNFEKMVLPTKILITRLISIMSKPISIVVVVVVIVVVQKSKVQKCLVE